MRLIILLGLFGLPVLACHTPIEIRDYQRRLKQTDEKQWADELEHQKEKQRQYESYQWEKDPALRAKYLDIHSIRVAKDQSRFSMLAGYFQDKSLPSNLRAEAATTIGLLRSTAGLSILIEGLHDKDWFVSLNAAEALGTIGDTRAITPLVELLSHPEQNGMKVYGAILALAQLKSVEAIPKLISLMDKGSSNGGHAAKALGKIGDRSALPALLNAIAKSEDILIPLLAMESVGSLASQMTKPERDAATDTIISRIEAGMGAESEQMIRDLARLGSGRALAFLKKGFYSRYQMTVVWAFGEMGIRDPGVTSLIQEFRDRSPFCDRDAAEVERLADEALRKITTTRLVNLRRSQKEPR